jgi:hypothetical protein
MNPLHASRTIWNANSYYWSDKGSNTNLVDVLSAYEFGYISFDDVIDWALEYLNEDDFGWVLKYADENGIDGI